MESSRAASQRRDFVAYVLPMAVFLVLLAAVSFLKQPEGSFWRRSPEYWLYPAQTICCGGILFWFRREYDFAGIRRGIFAVAIALLVFALWISPQVVFGRPARTLGFNPEVFAANPTLFWATILLRFARLVVVVPLLEEIFWRGFLLRYLIDEKFRAVPFGAFSWMSFCVVTLAFGFAHSAADWPAAIATGALYNLVAHRTKSLSSCILAHALTNLLLGIWIMRTHQWGFW